MEECVVTCGLFSDHGQLRFPVAQKENSHSQLFEVEITCIMHVHRVLFQLWGSVSCLFGREC